MYWLLQPQNVFTASALKCTDCFSPKMCSPLQPLYRPLGSRASPNPLNRLNGHERSQGTNLLEKFNFYTGLNPMLTWHCLAVATGIVLVMVSWLVWLTCVDACFWHHGWSCWYVLMHASGIMTGYWPVLMHASGIMTGFWHVLMYASRIMTGRVDMCWCMLLESCCHVL